MVRIPQEKNSKPGPWALGRSAKPTTDTPLQIRFSLQNRRETRKADIGFKGAWLHTPKIKILHRYFFPLGRLASASFSSLQRRRANWESRAKLEEKNRGLRSGLVNARYKEILGCRHRRRRQTRIRGGIGAAENWPRILLPAVTICAARSTLRYVAPSFAWLRSPG